VGQRVGYMMDKIIEKDTLLEILFAAYPFLKHREKESPQPELVDVVSKIEVLMKLKGEIQ
jgi:hypothetical protein